MRRTGIAVALAGILAACGPTKLTGDEGGRTTTTAGPSEGTDSESSDSGEPDPTTGEATGPQEDGPADDGAEDTSLTFVPECEIICDIECDPFAQDCPDGEKCVAYGSTGGYWDANKCVPVTGDGVPGDSCNYGGTVEATDDCNAASACWDLSEVDGTWTGTCRAFCQGTPDDPDCAPDEACLIANEGSLNMCLDACDPLLGDCGEGTACVWSGDAFLCTTSLDTIEAGQPCGYINDCGPSLACLDADWVPNCEGSACCTPYCPVDGGAEGCAEMPGTECVAFFEDGEAPPEFDNVGVCIVP